MRIFLFLRYFWSKRIEKGLFFPKNSLFLADFLSQIDPIWAIVLLPRARIYVQKQKGFPRWLLLLYRVLGVQFLKRAPFWDKEGEKVFFLRKSLKKGEMEPLEVVPFFTLEKAGEIFLLKIEGMLGSAFSAPSFSGQKKGGLCFFEMLKRLVQNGLFFMPKRRIILKVEKAPKELLEKKEAHSLFAYLDALFFSVEKPRKVSYFFWRGGASEEKQREKELFSYQKQVYQKLAKLGKTSSKKIGEKEHLIRDLHLSSLDVTELIVFLEERFGQRVEFSSLQTVEDVIKAARGELSSAKEERFSIEAWEEDLFRKPLYEPEEKTLLEAFFQNGAREGRAICCVDGDSYISYNRAKSLVIGLALTFQNIQEKKVGVLLPSGATCSFVIFGLHLLNKIPVMLNPTLGEAPFTEMLHMGGCKTIITLKKGLQKIPFPIQNKGLEILFLEEKQKELSLEKRKQVLSLSKGSWKSLTQFFSLKTTGKDPATLLFTSGSEGKVKGVLLSSENLLENQKGAIKRIHFTEKEVLLALLPPFHVFGFSISQVLPFVFGSRVVFCTNPLDLTSALFQIKLWQVSLLCTSPTLLEALFSVADPVSLQSVQKAVIGAEKPSSTLFAKANNFPWIQIIQGYGLTECSPIVSLQDPTKEGKGVGTALENVEVAILDETKSRFLSENQKGFICVSGKSVFSGYINTEEKALFEKEKKRWFCTKDIGYKDGEGNLFIEGRASRFIKKAGENISLDRIEQALQSTFTDRECAVLEGEKKLILVTTKEIALTKVNEALREKGLSPLFFVDKVVIMPQIFRFITGKVNYTKIKKALGLSTPAPFD